MRELVTEVFKGLECYSGRGYRIMVDDVVGQYVYYTTLEATFDHPPMQSWCLTIDDFKKYMYSSDLPDNRYQRPSEEDLYLDNLFYSTDLSTTYVLEHICKYGTDCSITMLRLVNVKTREVINVDAKTFLKNSITIKR